MAAMERIKEKQANWDAKADAMEKYLKEGRKIRLENRDKSIPEITEFFRGKCVLMTGGTGFVGKVLIEKLLRSIPDLDKIYVIVRPKKNQNPDERAASIVHSDLFDLIRSQRPQVLNKVIAVAGDMSSKGLGLSPQDRDLLQREVSIVFHVAASVRFDDPLKEAVLLNLRGTHELIELSKGMRNLKSFAHISTTYCNTNQSTTLEKVYPTPYDWRDVIKLAETTPNSDLQALIHKLLGFQPNTYTFTKQLAEKCVDDARSQIPVIIIRPSVVIGTCAEPMVGWTDNFFGPMGIIVAALKGVMRISYANNLQQINYIFVDQAVSVTIASSWLRGTNQALSDGAEIDVVNVSVEQIFNPTHEEVMAIYPLAEPSFKIKSLRLPSGYNTTDKWWFYYYRVYTSHIPFSLFVDLILKINGQKPRLMKIIRVMHNVSVALDPFMVNKYYNSTENMWKVMAYTTEPDFQCNLKVDMYDWSVNAIRYIFKSILKEEQAGPYHRTVLNVIHYIQQAVKYAFLIWCVWKLSLYLSQRYNEYFAIPLSGQP